METRHIRLDYEETLDSKKQLLSTQLNLLHIIKILKSYAILRKKELITKNKLKNQLNFVEKKIDLIESTFPDQTKKQKLVKIEKKIEKAHMRGIQKELDDIKSKLEKLK